MMRIAAFITPHGYGHATRTIALLEALQQRQPDLQLHLFTTVPEHLFTTSLVNLTIEPVVTDIGVIQQNALSCDIPATINQLNSFLPFASNHLDTLAAKVADCRFVLSDISALGIAVARRAAIPSILIENFTWDWIYKPYTSEYPELHPFVEMLARLYGMADYRIQTEPVCNPLPGTISCPPIFRRVRQQASRIRQAIGAGDRKLVLISMGGINFSVPLWQQLEQLRDCFFLLAGQQQQLLLSNNVMTLAHDSGYYHPDLIKTADLVVCKSGYSTVAECHQAGTRLVCIVRPEFAESEVLGRFVTERMGGFLIEEEVFVNGEWLTLLPRYLAAKPPAAAAENGADLVAEILLPLLH